MAINEFLNNLLLRLWWGGVGFIDFILVIAIFLGFVRGYRNGLTKELGLITELWVSMVFTIRYSQLWAETVSAKINFPIPFVQGILFFVLAGTFALIAKFVLTSIAKAVTLTFAKTLNRVGGIIIGGVRFALLTSIVCYGLLLFETPNMKETIVTESRSGYYLSVFPNGIYNMTEYFLDRAVLVSKIN